KVNGLHTAARSPGEGGPRRGSQEPCIESSAGVCCGFGSPAVTAEVSARISVRSPGMLTAKRSRSLSSILAIAALVVARPADCPAAEIELHVGGATVSITPDRPVALAGQMHTRVAREVETPVTATALALESREGDRSLDRAILVSCDLVSI